MSIYLYIYLIQQRRTRPGWGCWGVGEDQAGRGGEPGAGGSPEPGEEIPMSRHPPRII